MTPPTPAYLVAALLLCSCSVPGMTPVEHTCSRSVSLPTTTTETTSHERAEEVHGATLTLTEERIILAHVSALERRALAAEARASRYETELRRCEHWFAACASMTGSWSPDTLTATSTEATGHERETEDDTAGP